MNAQQLKNSILQMAIQGKLVPQDPNDEPASVLIERIREEKEKLIKEKKIKKEKNPSFIFRGTDNITYEKVGKNEPVSIEEELPFEIPESWEWVRFKNLVNYSLGKTPPRKEVEYWSEGTIPWVSIADLVADGTVIKTKECVNEYAAKKTFKGGISKVGTLLMSFKLTVGKVSILEIDAFHNEAIISIYPYIDTNRITTRYLFKVLPILSQEGDTKSAIKGKTLNSTSLGELLIPLPPLMEQKRIFDKIQELAPFLKKYDAVDQEVTKLNGNFPSQIKKSILQEAVQGRLVPQDPSDEPASVLLERIRAEKQRLIKEGKIKKDKNESIIYRRDNSHYEKLNGIERCIDDEIPFEIPESWEWVRFVSVINLQSGQDLTPDMYNDNSKGIPYITGASNIEDGKVIINRWTDNGRAFAYTGDLLLTCKGTVGLMAVLERDKVHIARQIMAIQPIIDIAIEYVKLTIETMVGDLKSGARSMIPGITRGDVLQRLIPLPPLAEQYRIVKRVEELQDLIKEL